MEWLGIVGLLVTVVSVLTAIKSWLSNNTISRDHSKLSERVVTLEASISQTTKGLSELNAQVHQLALNVGVATNIGSRQTDCIAERCRIERDQEQRLRALEVDDGVDKLKVELSTLAGQIDAIRSAALHETANIERVAEIAVYRALDGKNKKR